MKSYEKRYPLEVNSLLMGFCFYWKSKTFNSKRAVYL